MAVVQGEILTNVFFLTRYQGEPVNLREQHDALEFFNSLIDILDEGLKAVGHEPVLIRVLGGTFADQKICKGCPHRFVLCFYHRQDVRLCRFVRYISLIVLIIDRVVKLR